MCFCHSTHQLDGGARGVGALHGELRERVDRKERLPAMAERLGAEDARACRLTDAHLALVNGAVRLLHVGIGVRHLLNVADGLQWRLPVDGRVRRDVAGRADIARVELRRPEHGAHGAWGVVRSRHIDESRVGLALTVVRVGAHDGAVRGGEPPGDDCRAAVDSSCERGKEGNEGSSHFVPLFCLFSFSYSASPVSELTFSKFGRGSASTTAP